MDEYLADLRIGFRIQHDGAGRHRHDDVGAAAARLVVALAMLATFGSPAIAIGVVQQRREVCIGAEVHVAAGAAVTAIRTAGGHELLAAEGSRAGAAGTGSNSDDDAIDEIVMDAHDGPWACSVCAVRTWPHSMR